ncbi:MAG: Rrf2 family transcriptional regulator [Phycisphaerae bacterium]
MLTLTSQYALRALVYLAQHEKEWPIPGWHIAQQAGVPAKYLSKVLGDLVRFGVLESSPGRTGGFQLRRSPKATMLFDVLSPFERFDRRRCPFENKECSDENPCQAHRAWKKVVDAEKRFLKGTSVHQASLPARKRGKAHAG